MEIRPQVTTEYRLIATNQNGEATASVEVGVGVNLESPRIVELLADSAGGLEDEDGDRADWIELWNPNRHSYSLEGHYLSDDPDQLAKAAELPKPKPVHDGQEVLFS